MRFIVNKKTLSQSLSKIKKCAGNNSNVIEISSSVLLKTEGEKMKIKATDFHMFIENIIEIKESDEYGEVIVPFKVFYGLVNKASSNMIEAERINNELVLKGKGYKYKIPIIDSSFPTDYIVSSDVEVDIEESRLRNIVERFNKVIPNNAHKKVFESLNINPKDDDTVDFVATDSYRMYYSNITPINISGKDKGSYLVSKDMITYMKSILEKDEDSIINISLNDDYIKLTKGDFFVKHQLLNGSYPDYERVMPDNLDNTIEINVDKTKKALNRIKTVSSFMIGDNLTRIKGNKNGLELLTSDKENKENLKSNGVPKVEVNLDYNHMIDFLTKADSDIVSFSYNSSNESTIIMSDDSTKYMMVPSVLA